MKENAKRIVFFEKWMDTPAAMEIFENAEDIQVQKLQYDTEAEENGVAMSRAHGYQVQPRTELQIPWFPDGDLIKILDNTLTFTCNAGQTDHTYAGETAVNAVTINLSYAFGGNSADEGE